MKRNHTKQTVKAILLNLSRQIFIYTLFGIYENTTRHPYLFSPTWEYHPSSLSILTARAYTTGVSPKQNRDVTINRCVGDKEWSKH